MTQGWSGPSGPVETDCLFAGLASGALVGSCPCLCRTLSALGTALPGFPTRTKIYFLHQTERCYSAEGQPVTGRAGECKGWRQEQKPHLCQNWLLFTLACSLHVVGAHSVLPLKIPSTVRGEILSLFSFLLLLSQFHLHRGSPLCPWWTLTLEGLTGV